MTEVPGLLAHAPSHARSLRPSREFQDLLGRARARAPVALFVLEARPRLPQSVFEQRALPILAGLEHAAPAGWLDEERVAVLLANVGPSAPLDLTGPQEAARRVGLEASLHRVERTLDGEASTRPWTMPRSW